MPETERHLIDVKLRYNKPKLAIGLILIGLSIIFAFLSPLVGRIIGILGAIICGIVGSYILSRSQELGKDISLKLTETIQSRASIKVVKKDKNGNIIEVRESD